MAYRTTEDIIDREAQQKQIESALGDEGRDEQRLAVYEYYGIAGIGKSRILDAARESCRSRRIPFAVVDFLTIADGPLERQILDLLLRICDQFDHDFSLAEVRRAVTGVIRDGHGLSRGREDELEQGARLELMLSLLSRQLGDALGKRPLVLLLDSIERCSDSLFDWFGCHFLMTLLEQQPQRNVVIFLAGRGSRVRESQWPRGLLRLTTSMRLDPLDFAATEEHLGALPPNGAYRDAARDIYALSNGHPYSTEAIVDCLHQLDVVLPDVAEHRGQLAERLYEEVIRHYVLAGTGEEWMLPILEMGSIARKFNAGILATLDSKYSRDPGYGRPVQWYVARLSDLQRAPLYLVSVGQSTPAYELVPVLRSLLHTALVILKRDQVVSLHRFMQSMHGEELAKSSASYEISASLILEILYHTAQLAIIEDKDVLAAVTTVLDRLLRDHFHPGAMTNAAPALQLLKDLLSGDNELRTLQDGLASMLSEKVTEFAVLPATDFPFELSYLSIRYSSPSEYRLSWYHADQAIITDAIAHSQEQFTPEQWRNETERCGRLAFRSYLPGQAQAYLHRYKSWALQLITDSADIPWELLHDGNDFLCLSRPVARKVEQLKEPVRHEIRKGRKPRALIIGNPTGDLKGAQEEAESIAESLRARGVMVDALIGRDKGAANQFTFQLTNGYYDLIHYAGHSYFEKHAPHLSGLLFSDHPVYAEELERLLSSPAFIFFSSCESTHSQTISSMAGFRGKFVEGLATSALLGGAIGCLGPLWPVEDGLAKTFALAFYDHLFEGRPVGEAVRQARLHVRDMDPKLWATWILYGDPLRQLTI